MNVHQVEKWNIECKELKDKILRTAEKRMWAVFWAGENILVALNNNFVSQYKQEERINVLGEALCVEWGWDDFCYYKGENGVVFRPCNSQRDITLRFKALACARHEIEENIKQIITQISKAERYLKRKEEVFVWLPNEEIK